MSSVLLIGTGRLAFHLGHALARSGNGITGVMGRNQGNTEALAKTLECPAFKQGGELPKVDLRIIAVSDDAIAEVAGQLPVDGTPVVHLSGSKSVGLLAPHVHRGVLWPIHSFSPGDPADFTGIPLVVDADDAGTMEHLMGLARSLSRQVAQLPFEKRQRLHLSAVITANFPVFLLREAERLLDQHGIDRGLLLPLWKSATAKAVQDADIAVTGPARRGDTKTIALQKGLLADEPELRRAYVALSDLILHTYHPESRDHQDL
ncbi:MAG: DUF2520 domain-containing protein [Bacteroidetes bacterium]|nr:DUF2520 domain-containing protein [Bacteroidota bacterium]MBS1940829.1 DUF2520 domain-containing protein [Bacteroidota bacterium]